MRQACSFLLQPTDDGIRIRTNERALGRQKVLLLLLRKFVFFFLPTSERDSHDFFFGKPDATEPDRAGSRVALTSKENVWKVDSKKSANIVMLTSCDYAVSTGSIRFLTINGVAEWLFGIFTLYEQLWVDFLPNFLIFSQHFRCYHRFREMATRCLNSGMPWSGWLMLKLRRHNKVTFVLQARALCKKCLLPAEGTFRKYLSTLTAGSGVGNGSAWNCSFSRC